MDIEDFSKGKRIFIELGSQLQIKIDGVDGRLSSLLIGMKPDEYLIVSAPISKLFSTIKEKLLVGNEIKVRHVHQGTIFDFKSKIVEAINRPQELLFIAYPDIIEEQLVRAHKRVDCLLPAKVKIDEGEHDVIILDISEGGCRCLLVSSKIKKISFLHLENNVSLRFELPGIKGQQSVLGEIRNLRRDNEEIFFGVKFQNIAPEVKNLIAQFSDPLISSASGPSEIFRA